MNTNSLIAGALDEIRGVLEDDAAAEVDKLCDELLSARRIACYGVGREGLMMRALCMRLMHSLRVWSWVILLFSFFESIGIASDTNSPEAVLRALVQANAEKDLATLSRLIAHDVDIISYTIEGRKYVGWGELARDLQAEFDMVARLEIPIIALTVWTRGETAWFAMELDYIRYIGQGSNQRRTLLALRETGVLERRAGGWVLTSWHESSRNRGLIAFPASQLPSSSILTASGTVHELETADLSGEWEIEEEDKSYKATLDRSGNGSYTHQGGRLRTIEIAGRKWQGTWRQPGNDREGGFEVLPRKGVGGTRGLERGTICRHANTVAVMSGSG